jgi:hypothetical protein
MKIYELNESIENEVALIFGRFNPPHKGHRAAWELASKNPVWFVGTNENTQGPKDPLPFNIKIEAMKTIWPQVENHIISETSWFTAASNIYKKYGNVVLLCLTDEDWVTKAINDYNGKEGAHGFYNFSKIEQRPTPRLSSASSLRDAVIKGDRAAFSQAAGVSADTEVAGKPFFDLVAEYLLPYQTSSKKTSKKKTSAAEDISEAGSFYRSDSDEERRMARDIERSRREFKRRELETELGHEDDPHFQSQLRYRSGISSERKPVLIGMYFYDIPPDAGDLAKAYGLKQTKSGKWAVAIYNTSGEATTRRKELADLKFGPGKYWSPKTQKTESQDLEESKPTTTKPLKPRQGPLRTQTGSGVHRNKKKEEKLGQEKHKKPFVNENSFNEASKKLSTQQRFERNLKKAGYDVDASIKRINDLLRRHEQERQERLEKENNLKSTTESIGTITIGFTDGSTQHIRTATPSSNSIKFIIEYLLRRRDIEKLSKLETINGKNVTDIIKKIFPDKSSMQAESLDQGFKNFLIKTRHRYPDSKDENEAFMRYVYYELEHGDQTDNSQFEKITDLEKKLNALIELIASSKIKGDENG